MILIKLKNFQRKIKLMFSDPQFWVAVSFVLFILAIFNPVRKILITKFRLSNQ